MIKISVPWLVSLVHVSEKQLVQLTVLEHLTRCYLIGTTADKKNQLISGVASPTISSRYANSKLLSLFISLEIDCFHSQ